MEKTKFLWAIFLCLFANTLIAQNCPQTVAPVCGTDGVTYLNSCYAEAAGVSDYTYGVCYSDCIDPNKINPTAICTQEYQPVCACNNVTYKNACEAEAAGVTNYSPGRCGDDNRACYIPELVIKSAGTSVNKNTGIITLVCSQQYDPVCGCDGVTYANACMAEASGIAKYTSGSCSTGCIDYSQIDPDAICATLAYEPVCGCNEVTYPSACSAEAAGVTSYTPGQCGNSNWCNAAVPIQCGDFFPNETTVGENNYINNYPGCTSKSLLGPEKIYVINKTTAGDLQIGLEIITPGLDLDIFLLKDDCDQVTCLKASLTNNQSTNNEGIIYPNAPIGTYYIVVDGQYANSEGEFRLEVSCGYLDCTDTKELWCGEAFQYSNANGDDNVSLYTCGNVLNVENNGPEIVHSFSMTEAGSVDISLTGLSANLELFLLSSCDRGACLKYSQKSGTQNEHISTYLDAGTYYVVVDGYNGAISDYNLLVQCDAPCNLNVTAWSNGTDCGQNNGEIIIESTGGTPGYIVEWSGPTSGQFFTYSNRCTISNLPSGTYWIKKTDKFGCTDMAEVTINDTGGNIALDAKANPAICDAYGSIKVNLFSGIAPFKVQLSGPTNKMFNTNYYSFLIDDLAPGEYHLYIYDNNGCSVSKTLIIQQASGNFYFDAYPKEAHCETPGYIDVRTFYGDAPYYITLQGPVSGTAVTSYKNFRLPNLPGGTYKLTIKDANWCSYSKTVVVDDENMSISAYPENGICGKSGAIKIYIDNGKANYHIYWDGPVKGDVTTPNPSYNITNLPSGTYSITVKDGNWCTDYQVVTIDNSDNNLNVDASSIDGICQLGAIWLDINNGTPPYKIQWAGPSSGLETTSNSGFDIRNLSAGTYSISIIDNNGCTAYKIVQVDVNLGPTIQLTASDAKCEHKAAITVKINGGIPGFHIEWDGPSSGIKTVSGFNFEIPNLLPGTYKVTVWDAYSCDVSKTIVINDIPNNLEIWTDVTNGVCGSNGSVKLTVNNGSPNYTFSWTGPVNGNHDQASNMFTIDNLPSGEYQITAKDGNGCTKSKTINITNTDDDVYAKFICNVTGLNANFTNESSAGTYEWDFGDGETSNATNPSHTFCDEGEFTICLKVTNDCGTSNYCKGITVTIPTDVCVLDVGEVEGKAGSNVAVPVTIHNCSNLVSLAASLNIVDTNVGEILGISGYKITPSYNEDNSTFNYFNNSGVPVDLINGDTLFFIIVNLTGYPGDMTRIKITNNPLPIELGVMENGSAVIVPVQLLKGKISVLSTGNITGRVQTYWDEGIMDANVTLNSNSFNSSTMTNEDGTYMLPEVPFGEMYDIYPKKDLAPANGLSTYALFAGQRFILGYEPAEITSPYQIIGGDANCSGSFTTLDLFIIQQIIIGVKDNFTECPSWVFIADGSGMPDNFDAYNVFPYSNSRELMITQDTATNFIGVKVGDILGHANPTNFRDENEVKIRNTNELRLQTAYTSIRKGETFSIEFNSDNFEKIVSYQLALDFDNENLHYENFEAATNNYLKSVQAGATEGHLRISWYDVNGQGFTANADTDLFSITFTAKEDIDNLSELLSISNRSIVAEAHNTGAEALDVVLEFTEQTTPVSPVLDASYQLHQNIPNPFSNWTSISFELPENMEADLIIHNKFGQVIRTYHAGYKKGINKLSLEDISLSSGVYFYTLKAKDFTSTKSMIVIK